MIRFTFRRIVNGGLVMLGVIVIIFSLFNVLPADPARMMLGQRADSASVSIINRDLGLDQPIHIRFLIYLNDLSPLSIHSLSPGSHLFLNPAKYSSAKKLFQLSADKVLVIKAPYLRRSYQNKSEVSTILIERIPDTAILAFAAILLASIIGISLGIISALKKDTWIDRLALIISISGVSLPSFFASIIFAWLFGFLLSSYTGLNMTGGLTEVDPFKGEYLALKNLILPSLVLGFRPLAIIVQLTRSSMLEVLSQDYIRTGKAKGLSKGILIRKHALRNAMNPVVTAISGWLGSLLAGAVFVEYIFGWNGIGKLTVTALENYDLPVIMGIVLFISLVFIILNILADLLNGALDPRIRAFES
ncbi:MAG: ABC transporter permease [Bacteroidetes bacterium]|nr:MAG: ABC transporter permease [Bacteroidota bacterium]